MLNRIKYSIAGVALTILVYFTFSYITTNHAYGSTEAWNSATNLPYKIASHTSFSKNNEIFVIGGSSAFGQSKAEVLSSQINGNQDNLNWTTDSQSTPAALIFHAQAVEGNFVYILGGKEENPGSAGDNVNKVYLGKITSGKISSWDTLNPLPKASSLGAAAIVNHRLYYAGGQYWQNGNEIMVQNVYSAPINSDGTIGDWVNAGLLPTPNYGLGMIAANNNLIIIGGATPSGHTGDTYKAAFDSAGKITSWQQLTSLPENSYRSSFAMVGSTLYVIGAGTNVVDKVYSAQVNNDGTIGEWTLNENRLPQQVWGGAAAVVNDTIYLLGGFNGSYLDTVYYMKVKNDNILKVPYFSQNSLPWGPQEYDHAALVRLNNPTIDRWGCAMTSAAMVLNYHGIQQFTDGTPITPETLNNWLKQHNGYVYGKGTDGSYAYLIWPAIGTLTKELYDAGRAPIKLMHKRVSLKDAQAAKDTLDNDLLVNKIPDILQVKNASTSGHFVVATGKDNNNVYTINDPEWNVPDLSSFGNKYYQIDRYVPSHTNLSYILTVVNPGIQVLVIAPNGKKTGKIVSNGMVQSYDEIPNASYSFSPPISNPDTKGLTEELGTGVNEFLLPEPINGTYTIMFSSLSLKDYTANIALYQTDGTNEIKTFTGTIDKNKNENISVAFNTDSPSTSKKIVTFENTIDEIKELRKLNHITNDIAANGLIILIEEAQKNYKSGRKKVTSEALKGFEASITLLRNKNVIDQSAYQILLYDVEYLELL